MKLDILFSQYLYQHKKLVLPGIGTFTLDPAAAIPDDTEKQRSAVTGITYDSKSAPKIEEELIEFIRSHTGKIRPLAVSDIESYISLSSQLLNIGNPLYVDGIGTLIKGKDGRLNFTPGSYVSAKLEDITVIRESTEPRRHEETFSRRESSGNNARQLLIGVAALITLVIVGGGAYYLYQSNAHKKATETEVSDTVANAVVTDLPNRQSGNAYMPDSNLIARDSAAMKRKADSLAALQNGSQQLDSTGKMPLKYVLEVTANKYRALKRFTQLRENGNKVQMDVAPDSSSFKLYFLIPSVYSDTTHIKDSLTRFFLNKVRIEK
ncbi:hypothetical protein [Pinibacter soli]|uniref:CCDC81-like prokaryotic HU domain-containing protein n=1 Tax=Pinibacter soli TaxID=3044211 RepID=A0ABT6RGH9_9BACT|nr:hypothetical protein [Pinibacter soli]MDI3321667.1 hypothetical protein [Pinibacter soli]